MSVRKIIRIDEDRCDGCGLCVLACAEGAIQVINGKARLVSDSYCDGLGACIGDCPQNAIEIIEREAQEFSEIAVKKHLAGVSANKPAPEPVLKASVKAPVHACPGSFSRSLHPARTVLANDAAEDAGGCPSQLANWPVQLKLAPVKAPYFEGAKLLIAADCVPFALPDFHSKFLAGRTLLIGCPKLDDAALYRQKLAEIFRQNDIKSVEVAFMEVPCCFGLVQLVNGALEDSGKELLLNPSRIGIRGDVKDVRDTQLRREVS